MNIDFNHEKGTVKFSLEFETVDIIRKFPKSVVYDYLEIDEKELSDYPLDEIIEQIDWDDSYSVMSELNRLKIKLDFSEYEDVIDFSFVSKKQKIALIQQLLGLNFAATAEDMCNEIKKLML